MTFQPFASTSPSSSDNAYILSLALTSQDGLAAITSVDELLLLDPSDLAAGRIASFQGVPKKLNSLDILNSNVLVCGSGSGTVALFDLRTRGQVSSWKSQRAVTTIACNGHQIGVGTEYASQQAVVSVWDSRTAKQLWQNGENNEDITCLAFHPSKNNVLLAGGDDGLVSLYDTNITEEEDSLLQVINHSPIHIAGFMGEQRIYAISSDQNLAIHPVSSEGDEEDPVPTQIGDLRPIVPCEYVIDVLKSGKDFVIAAGTNIEASRVDLIKLNDGPDPSLNLMAKYILAPAHGEEVVRSLVVNENSGVIFTAGEDGMVQAFKQLDTSDVKHSGEVQSVGSVKSPKEKRKKAAGRYEPY